MLIRTVDRTFGHVEGFGTHSVGTLGKTPDAKCIHRDDRSFISQPICRVVESYVVAIFAALGFASSIRHTKGLACDILYHTRSIIHCSDTPPHAFRLLSVHQMDTLRNSKPHTNQLHLRPSSLDVAESEPTATTLASIVRFAYHKDLPFGPAVDRFLAHRSFWIIDGLAQIQQNLALAVVKGFVGYHGGDPSQTSQSRDPCFLLALDISERSKASSARTTHRQALLLLSLRGDL